LISKLAARSFVQDSGARDPDCLLAASARERAESCQCLQAD